MITHTSILALDTSIPAKWMNFVFILVLFNYSQCFSTKWFVLSLDLANKLRCLIFYLGFVQTGPWQDYNKLWVLPSSRVNVPVVAGWKVYAQIHKRKKNQKRKSNSNTIFIKVLYVNLKVPPNGVDRILCVIYCVLCPPMFVFDYNLGLWDKVKIPIDLIF